MRFGLKVNAGSWDEAQRWAGVAEDVGFHGLWTGDNMRNPRDPSVPGLSTACSPATPVTTRAGTTGFTMRPPRQGRFKLVSRSSWRPMGPRRSRWRPDTATAG